MKVNELYLVKFMGYMLMNSLLIQNRYSKKLN